MEPEDIPSTLTNVGGMDGSGVLAPLARRVWLHLETAHALTYFAPESRAAFADAGLRGFWRGYFAGRAAPLGAVGAGPVVAAFHGFHPEMVARAIPSVWELVAPAGAIAARLAGVDAALRRIAPDDIAGPAVAEAADLARRIASAASPAGRVLHAANADLAWPDAPHLALWQAATTLREHRGDGHVALLVAADLDGCEAHVLMVATGRLPRDVLQPNRGWSDDDWDRASARLAARGLVDARGQATDAGSELRRRIEDDTDALALQPYATAGPEVCERLIRALTPLTRQILDAGDVPARNPMGAPITDA